MSARAKESSKIPEHFPIDEKLVTESFRTFGTSDGFAMVNVFDV